MQSPPNRLAMSGSSAMPWRRALWFTGCEKPGGPEPGSIQDINTGTKCQHQKRDLPEWKKKTEPGWFWHPEHENHFGCWNWNHENFWMSQPEPDCFQGVNYISGCQHQNRISDLSGCQHLTNFQYIQHELHHKKTFDMFLASQIIR